MKNFQSPNTKKKDKKNLVVFFAADTFILTYTKSHAKPISFSQRERETDSHDNCVCEFYSCLLGGVRPAIRTNPPVKG